MSVSAAQKMNCLWPLSRGGKGWVRGNLDLRYAAAIKGLLRTPMGQYPWAPTYGTTIYRLQAQSGPYDEFNAAVEAELSLAFQQWIPDVSLLGILIAMDPLLQRLGVTVTWGVMSQQGGSPTYILGPVRTTVPI